MSKKILDKKQIEDFFNDPYNEEVIELISQTIASYIVSAITANLSPDLIKKALTDIIKTVSPEPTSETKEQNIDIKNKTKDWSKHSDATLRREHSRHKQKGLPIEDSLNEELAKRFPGYSAETRTFGKHAKRKNTNWSNSSKDSIRNTYYTRKKKGLPIEDSLNEELAKRFPNYNPEKKTFENVPKNVSSFNTKITNQKKSKQKIDVNKTQTNTVITIPLFSAINKNGKYDLYTYDKENKPIKLMHNSIAEYDLYFYDDAFNKAVVRKKNDINFFSLYIIDTQKGSLLRLFNQGIDILRYIPQNHKILLSGKNSLFYTAIAPNSKIEKIINVPLNVEILKAQSTPKHTVFINKNCEEIKVPLLKITDESKLEKRNNLINHLLGKLSSTPQIKESKSENQNVKEEKQETKTFIDWSKSSANSIKTAYYRRKRESLPIEDSLNEELAKRFPNYNAEKRTFGKNAKRKNTNWSNSSKDSLRNIYYSKKKAGKPIEDSLNEELAKRFDNYDKEQKAFTPRQKSKKDWCKYSDMGLRNIYNKQKKEGLEIEDSLNEELAKRFKKYDSETRTFVKQKDLAQKAKENIDNHDSKNATVIIPSAHTVEALPKTEKEQYQKIIVEIKPIKMTLEGTYNDVFVNGRKILKNHINTEVQLFCEDTILGIHGIISGNKYYPESPIWLIYDANIQQRPPEQKNIITKHNILVKKIYNYPEEIRLELDNRAIVILKNEKMKKIAELRRFVLDKQK